MFFWHLAVSWAESFLRYFLIRKAFGRTSQSDTRYWDLTWATLHRYKSACLSSAMRFARGGPSDYPAQKHRSQSSIYQCGSWQHDLCDNTNTRRSRRLKTPTDPTTLGHRHWRSEQ